jgi:Flp pilus assembly protein TadD
MAGLAAHSRWYAGMFINTESLWACAVQVNPWSPLAHNNFGCVLAEAGRKEEAIEQLEEAVTLNSDNASYHNSLGTVLLEVGRTSEAAEQFRQALSIKPDFTKARNNLQRATEKSVPVEK